MKYEVIVPTDPEYPIEDWQYEVQNGDTRMAYWDWVAKNRTQDEADRDECGNCGARASLGQRCKCGG